MDVFCSEQLILLDLFHHHLKRGCFCGISGIKVDELVSVICTRSDENDTAGDGDAAYATESTTMTMLSCSLIEGVSYLYRNLLRNGKICKTLVQVVRRITSFNICKGVTTFLVDMILIGTRFVSYAAVKALVAYLLLENEISQNGLLAAELSFAMSEKLVAHEPDKGLGVLSFFEHFLMALGRSGNDTTLTPSFHSENCQFEKVTQSLTNVVNVGTVCSILQAQKVLPRVFQIASVTEDVKTKFRWIQDTLRILIAALEREDDSVRGTLLQDAPLLLTLLDNAMPLLVWERSCDLIRNLLNRNSTGTEGETLVKGRCALASQFLHMATSKIWDEMPRSQAAHRGFGGPFSTSGPMATVEECPQADKAALQTFLLAHLASLANVSAQLDAKRKAGLSPVDTTTILFQNGLQSVQQYLKCQMIPRLAAKTSSEAPHVTDLTFVLCLLDDQDDVLVETLLYMLDISIQIYSSASENRHLQVEAKLWNPHVQFNVFLIIINKDYRVILDLLISEETCFLLYFLKYLKLALSNWSAVVRTHKTNGLVALQREMQRTLYRSQTEESPTTADRGTSGAGGTCQRWKDQVNSDRLFSVDVGIGDQILVSKSARTKLDTNHGNTVSGRMNLVDYDNSSDSDCAEREDTLMTSPCNVSGADSRANSRTDRDFSDANKDERDSLLDLCHICHLLCTSIEKQVRKDLFPYNAKPLVRLLKRVIRRASASSTSD